MYASQGPQATCFWKWASEVDPGRATSTQIPHFYGEGGFKGDAYAGDNDEDWGCGGRVWAHGVGPPRTQQPPTQMVS